MIEHNCRWSVIFKQRSTFQIKMYDGPHDHQGCCCHLSTHLLIPSSHRIDLQELQNQSCILVSCNVKSKPIKNLIFNIFCDISSRPRHTISIDAQGDRKNSYYLLQQNLQHFCCKLHMWIVKMSPTISLKKIRVSTVFSYREILLHVELLRRELWKK